MKRSIQQWQELGPAQQAQLTEAERVDALYDAVFDIRQLHSRLLQAKEELVKTNNRNSAELMSKIDYLFNI